MKTKIAESRKGEFFIGGQIVFWALLPILSKFAYNFVDPLFATALATFTTVFIFGGLLTIKRGWKKPSKEAWKYLLASTIFINVIFYGMMFLGTKYTSSGNVSIIALMETFFTFLILGLIWGKEKIYKSRVFGAILMIIGALMVLLKGKLDMDFNSGDLLILAATAVPPIGNYFQQQARKYVSGEFMMFFQGLISSIIVFGLSLGFESFPSSDNIVKALPFIILMGALTLGFARLFWIEAIHRMSVSKGISLRTATPIFTLIFAFILLGDVPTAWQIAGFVPILVGALLVLKEEK